MHFHRFNRLHSLQRKTNLVARFINLFVTPPYLSNPGLECFRERIVKRKMNHGVIQQRCIYFQSHAIAADIKRFRQSRVMRYYLSGFSGFNQGYFVLDLDAWMLTTILKSGLGILRKLQVLLCVE